MSELPMTAFVPRGADAGEKAAWVDYFNRNGEWPVDGEKGDDWVYSRSGKRLWQKTDAAKGCSA